MLFIIYKGALFTFGTPLFTISMYPRIQVIEIMAKPIGLPSESLAIATFAFNCSIWLYEVVNSFRSHPKRVPNPLTELEALSAVLGPLVEVVNRNTVSDVDLSSRNLPLLRYGCACNEFQQILKCLSQSGTNQISFRDWARLTYMGDDIDGFRRLLMGYKAPINSALKSVSLDSKPKSARQVWKKLVGFCALMNHLHGIVVPCLKL